MRGSWKKDLPCCGPLASDQFAMACSASALPVEKSVGALVRCLLHLLVRGVRVKGVKWDGQSSASVLLRAVALVLPDKLCAQNGCVWYSDVSAS